MRETAKKRGALRMLAGLRVIEIEGIGPGPFAGMMLADLGAEVIKVQRADGPVSPGVPDRAVLDRGKRSIALDLKSDLGRRAVLRLTENAEVLIEGFRPGVMERLGLGPEPCHQVNPALVYGRMTGWGQSGPMAERAGHDMNYIGMAGALWHGGLPGQPPMAPPTLVGDIGGGAMYLVTGVLAGVLRARGGGGGCVVDAAIYDGAASMMNLLMTLAQAGGFQETRGHSLLDGPHWCRTYRCADGGFMSVQCLEPKFYGEFLHRMGLDADPDFAAQFAPRNWPALAERLAEIFASRPRAEWESVFEGSDACCTPVLTPQEAEAHPMNAARQVWTRADGALQATPAPRFDGKPASQIRPAPVRGQDTDAILAEIGLSGQ